MTFHTKAATDDILDIFNQPLRNMGPLSSQIDSAGESEFEDDDYTSAGESTGTGAVSGASEYGDDENVSKNAANNGVSADNSASPWSEFTASKHLPKLADDDDSGDDERPADDDDHGFVLLEDAGMTTDAQEALVTPIETEPFDTFERPRFVPLPPEDYEAPTKPYRDPSQVAQNRLPFMTPIVEKTESSMGALTIRDEKDYFNSKTPSRQHGDGSKTFEEEDEEDLLCSPLQEIINEAKVARVKEQSPVKARPDGDSDKPVAVSKKKVPTGPPIQDTRCNPIDDSIKRTILEHSQAELTSYPGYHDHRPLMCHKAPEIRKFIKALAKTAKGHSDKTTTNVFVPPVLSFPPSGSRRFTIKRELGKGAFAPVYLAQLASSDDGEEDGEHQLLSRSLTSSSRPTQSPNLLAIKCEDPPTPWEFYIMSTIHSRLDPSSRASASILLPYEMHLFADEGYLMEQYLDQGTLLDLVNTAKADSPSGVLDEAIAMFFTVELLRTVEALHEKRIMHGDLKADNCLVRLHSAGSSDDKDWDSSYHRDGSHGWHCKGLSLIDFGRGIDMAQFGPEAQFIADWKTSKAECPEIREMRPWTWQVDYWGCAGVVHSLLFGKYIEDVAVEAPVVKVAGDEDGEERTVGIKTQREKRWRIKEPLKRYWQCELWAGLFELLLNPTKFVEGEEENKMPVLNGMRRVREGMEDWLEMEGGRRGLRSGLRRLEEKVKAARK